MKRTLAITVALLAIAAYAVGRRNASITYTTALTAAGPTSNPAVDPQDPAGLQSCYLTDGGPGGCTPGAFHMTALSGYRATLCLPNGYADAGGLSAYYFSEGVSSAQWSRNPQIDETVTIGSASCRLSDAGTTACACQTFGDHITTGMGGGWLLLLPSGVNSSDGGVKATVTIDARQET